MIPIVEPIKGKYTSAHVMIDEIDSATYEQIIQFINHEAFTNHVAIMPDCHKGNGAVIGFTMPLTDKVIPNVIGVDINCGMLSMNVGRNIFAELTREKINEIIRRSIPFGTNVHRKDLKSINDIFFTELSGKLQSFLKKYGAKRDYEYNRDKFIRLCDRVGMNFDRAIKSIGTLGGGNHFIEIGKSENTKDYWITIHSGSRQLGQKICQYHQRQAGKGQLKYLTDEKAVDYLYDMVIAQAYADLNRDTMAFIILNLLNISPSEVIKTCHNFIDFDDMIIRKGAIRSYEGEKMIIPFNMQDGILICEGKSNPDWNFSAPHGAGRLGSRKWAKETLNQKDAEDEMESLGIYFSKLPLDEAKRAYKDPQIIEKAIEPTAKIIDRIKPIIAMKD